MPTVRSILCPVDFSEHSRAALRWAAAIAQYRGAELTVLSVIEPLLAQAAEIRLGVDLAQEDAEPALRKFVEATLPEGTRQALDVRTEVTIGDPSEAIRQTGLRLNVGLIVMGTHGLGGLRKLLLGSTTEQVLRQTEWPVLAVPVGGVSAPAAEQPGIQLKRILLATDFRESAMAATQWAGDLASDIGVPLVLAHVVEPVVVPQSEGFVADLEGDRVTSGQRILAKLAAGFRDTHTDQVVSLGRPADTIASIAVEYGAGLVVMGLANSEDSEPRKPGSIAYRVLRNAHVPVVVVPRADAQGASERAAARHVSCASQAALTVRRTVFRVLHERGCFVIPNPWDVGSARYLQHLGFPALATTSAGFAFSQGLPDSGHDVVVSRERSLAYIASIAGAVDLPVSADFMSGYGREPEDVAESVAQCVATGVAGLSIEDATGDPTAPLYELPIAVERVRAARQAIDRSGEAVLLTARAECYHVGHPDPFRESVRRLQAYAAAGADVLFAPGPQKPAEIRALVAAVAPKPLNLLVVGDIGLGVEEIAALGVRRISVGGALALAAWTGFIRAALTLKSDGSFAGLAGLVPYAEINGLFAAGLPGHQAQRAVAPRRLRHNASRYPVNGS